MYLYMKYIKLFTDHNKYQNFIESTDVPSPNISFCKNIRHIHFKPEETHLVAIFNITDTEHPTSITHENGWDDIEFVEVISPTNIKFTLTINDLVEYNSTNTNSTFLGYQFSETGDFTFKYTFKPNINIINYKLFSFIPYLKHIEIPYIIDIIDDEAFKKCINLNYVNMLEITTIGESAFQNCENLQAISLPDSITSMGMSAFENCVVLTNVKLPNNITTLSENLFHSCLELHSLTIPASVNNIELDALRFGQNMEDNYSINITVLSTTPPALDSTSIIGRSGSSFNYTKIHVPEESLDAYKTAAGWSNYSKDIVAI